MLFLSAALVIGGAFLLLSAIPAPADPDPAINSNYAVGDHVFDTGGNEWMYMGRTDLVVGQVSPELKLLTAFIFGQEKILYGLLPEEIPLAERGDIWKLLRPGPEFYSQLLKEGFIVDGLRSDWCNATGWDPPVAEVPYRGGTLVCARYYCGDQPSIPVRPVSSK